MSAETERVCTCGHGESWHRSGGLCELCMPTGDSTGADSDCQHFFVRMAGTVPASSTPETRAAQAGPAARELASLMAEVRKAEDAARLEGRTQGRAEVLADCESLVSTGLQALAQKETAAAEEARRNASEAADHGVVGRVVIEEARHDRHAARAACLLEIALAVSAGQFRTDAYDPELVAKAHRRASTSPAMASAGGKARQAKLTPKQKSKLAKLAATARWNRARRGE